MNTSPTPSPVFERWNDDLLLGHPDMDQTHEAFAQLLEQCLQCTDEELIERFKPLSNHLSIHFEFENQWMRRTEFPPRDCHIDEHAAVLDSARKVQLELDKGHVALARRFVHELSVWFPKHTQHLDSALAHWLSKSRLGGKPIIFKRSASQNGGSNPILA